MPTKPTQLRIPPDLLERIDAKAKQREMSRTAWIIEAAENHLLDFSRPDLVVNTRTGEAVEVTTVPVRDIEWPVPQNPKPWKCPVNDCDFDCGSSAVRCPHHNRQVVPF